MKEGMTKKQLEILELIAEGKKTREIAEELGNTYGYIEIMRHQMMARAGARNAAHLISIAHEKGWLKRNTNEDKQAYYTISNYAASVGVEISDKVFQSLREFLPKVCLAICVEVARIGNIELYPELVLDQVFVHEEIR